MAFDYTAAIAAAAATAPNMNEAQKGGGYTPPAAGVTRLRFVGYIEVGNQESTFQGETKIKPEVQLVFELSGPKHPPKKLDDGTLVPQRMTIFTTLSLNEKAGFFKLFKKMNYDGQATHMAQLLGKPFLGTVVHKPRKDGKGVNAYLKDDSGFTVRPAKYEDPATGEMVEVQVDAPITEIRCFLWNYPSKEMWDSLYIPGEYAAEGDRPARSKNVLQEKIRSADNWVGSPMYNILQGSGTLAEVAASEGDAFAGLAGA